MSEPGEELPVSIDDDWPDDAPLNRLSSFDFWRSKSAPEVSALALVVVSSVSRSMELVAVLSDSDLRLNLAAA